MRTIVLSIALILGTAACFPISAQVKDDLKTAGQGTKDAAKDGYKGSKKNVKKAGKVTKKEVKKGTNKAAKTTE